MQKGKASKFIFLNLPLGGRGSKNLPLRTKLQAGLQSELKLPLWSKNKQNKTSKELKNGLRLVVSSDARQKQI